VSIIWLWQSSSPFFSSKYFALAFSLLSFFFSRLISFFLFSKSVLKILIDFPFAFLQPTHFPASHISCKAFHAAQSGFLTWFRSFKTLALSWQSLKSVFKASSLVLVSSNVFLFFLLFLSFISTFFSSFSYVSKDMIF